VGEVPASAPAVGQLLDGRYKIVREIASGGMSIVYEAIHVRIGRVVAIKVLHRDMASDPEVVGRFLNEARAVGTFGHPNIVASTDFGELPGHVPYLVLEYLEGHTLAQEVQNDGPLPVRRATRIARQIASALEAAHARDVVHRDLTSANIFLVKREGNPDHVKVLDFGISKFLSVGDTGPKTRRGLTMGTPEYMSPEQISDPDAVDARVDVYALGVIMYLMLAGELPFTRTPLQSLLTQIVMDPPPPLARRGIPEPLEAILFKALAKHPADRFATMREMSAALEWLSAHILSGAAWNGSLDVPFMDSGARTPPPAASPGPMLASVPRPKSGSLSAPKLPPVQPASAPEVPITAPMMRTRGGHGLLYAALALAVASVGGVAALWQQRSQQGSAAAPAAQAMPAPAPAALAPPPPAEPAPIAVRITSDTPATRVTLRGRTHLLPFAQELKVGSEPEVVELTAPQREGRRFWLTFDHPIALAASLPEGRGMTEATEEETVIALGGKPVGGALAEREPSEREPAADERSSDKHAAGAHHHGGHRRSPGKLGAGQGTGASESEADSEAEPKADSPAEPKPAAPVAAAKTEALTAAKPAAATPSGAAPAPAATKAGATETPRAAAAAQPSPASGLDPAKTRALVKSHLPEIQGCYERAKMDDAELKGRIVLRISVSATGTVTSTVVESSSLRSSAVESCVVDAVQSWKFPPPVGGPAVISYPFNLR